MGRIAAACCAALALLAAAPAWADDGDKRIVLISGEAGKGIHKCQGLCALFTEMLNGNDLPLDVAHFETWPEDWSKIEGADAIIFYCNGGDLHPAAEKLEEIDAMAKAGTGIVCMHQALGAPDEASSAKLREWIGGHFEGGYSSNPFWVADVTINEDHPVARGVAPFAVEDEWYYNMRFQPDMEGVTPILTATPTDENITEHRRGSEYWNEHAEAALGTPQVLMWAYERPDGGRGVGMTGGHFRHIWKNDDMRTIALNAMVWAAGGDVPAEGIASETPMYTDLD